MSKKPPISDEDRDLFRKAVEDATPLGGDDKVNLKPPKVTHKAKRRSFDESEVAPRYSDHVKEEVDVEAYLLFSPKGLQPKTLKKLRQGQLPIEAMLDLHGKNVDQARSELAHFIDACHQRGCRVIRIIHGKGYGAKTVTAKIKNMVNIWLPQVPDVLAFCSCIGKDGGTGAVYVLLKPKKSPQNDSDLI